MKGATAMLSLLTKPLRTSEQVRHAVAFHPLDRKHLLDILRETYQRSDGGRDSKRYTYRQLVYGVNVTPPQAQQLLKQWDAS